MRTDPYTRGVWLTWATIVCAGGFVGYAVALGNAQIVRPPNTFTHIAIHEVSTFTFTHAEISGRVALSKHEDDNDWHFRVTDDAGFDVVCEIIPELPRPHPKVNTCVTVQGIVRFDKHHLWYEIHPTLKWWVIPCAGR